MFHLPRLDSPKPVYLLAAIGTVAMLFIIPLQILVFALYRMPQDVYGWFDLFSAHPFVGFFHADLFILINNIIIAVVYMAFYEACGKKAGPVMRLALVLGLVGIAAYVPSNRAFELHNLASQYAAAIGERERIALTGAGMAMLAGWQGTAFDTYYVLNGFALLIISLVLYRDERFGKTTARLGLASAFLMMVPSTAGGLGLVFSLLSLVPWYIFMLRYAKVFFRLSRPVSMGSDPIFAAQPAPNGARKFIY
jgi:hypothetical protein